MTWKILFFRCPSTAPIVSLLASHMISNGRLQFGATTIGAEISFSFKVSKAFKHSSLKLKTAFFISSSQRGLVIFDKSAAETRMFQKTSDSFYRCRRWQLFDNFYLSSVHLNPLL